MERDCQHGLYKAGMGSSRVLSDFAEKYGSKNRVLAGFGIGGKVGKEKVYNWAVYCDRREVEDELGMFVHHQFVTVSGWHGFSPYGPFKDFFSSQRFVTSTCPLVCGVISGGETVSNSIFLRDFCKCHYKNGFRDHYDCSGAPQIWRREIAEILQTLGHLWWASAFTTSNPFLSNVELHENLLVPLREATGKGHNVDAHMSKISQLGWSFEASHHVVKFFLTLATCHSSCQNRGHLYRWWAREENRSLRFFGCEVCTMCPPVGSIVAS
ncbi:hypothetical protein Tco_0357452 [Tanacetum coccineum]